MLSPFQVSVQKAVAHAIEGSDFALAGGAALISQGVVHRSTDDLDFFSTKNSEVTKYVPKVITALNDFGYSVEIIQMCPHFVRMRATLGDNELELDFGADARLFRPQQGEFSPVLSTKELAVDKVLAVFGRAAARDFVDLAALTQYFEIEELFTLAKEKDRGFTVSAFLQGVNQFDRIRDEEFQLSRSSIEELKEVVESWRNRAQELTQKNSRDFGIEL
jgi:hypothetical protein